VERKLHIPYLRNAAVGENGSMVQRVSLCKLFWRVYLRTRQNNLTEEQRHE
jgi:hypothetical protein